MHHVLNSWCRQRLVDRVLHVLKNGTSRQVGVRGFEMGALMSNAATNVDIQNPVILSVPVLHVSLNGIYRQPCQLRRASQCHVIIEVCQIARTVCKPGKRMQWSVPGVLEWGMQAVGRPLVGALPEKLWQGLILRADGVEAARTYFV